MITTNLGGTKQMNEARYGSDNILSKEVQMRDCQVEEKFYTSYVEKQLQKTTPEDFLEQHPDLGFWRPTGAFGGVIHPCATSSGLKQALYHLNNMFPDGALCTYKVRA